MLKKVLWTIIIILVLIALAIWAPWDGMDLTFANLFGVSQPEEFSGLEVSSLKDTLVVYIDGEEQGRVDPGGGILEIPAITPGMHIIKLEKSDDEIDFYWELVQSIDFTPKLNVVMAYELGPAEIFSQGHSIYARDSIGNSEESLAKMNVSANVENAEVKLDGNKIGETPIEDYDLSLDSVHTLTIEREGYESLEFEILPTEQEDRDKLKGIELFIDTHLFWIPIEFSS